MPKNAMFVSAPSKNQIEDSVQLPRRALRTLFVITSMPVGGAEVLLVNLMRRFRASHVLPSIACLKDKGPLGKEIAAEFPVTDHWLTSKFDVRVLPRLAGHMRRQKIDAVITVGAGDKMFWGRLAAKLANVPVVCSALHSTGWPDGVGRLNRCLTSITDAFIAVAKPHGQFLIDYERFPANKVVVIPNGVDTSRFAPDPSVRIPVRRELAIEQTAPLIGIVAALRPEKNHALFIAAAHKVVMKCPKAHFLIIGDGPERAKIEELVQSKGLTNHVHLLGNRSDTPRLLAAMDIFALTSHNEASPVSILEALSCGVPVVSTRVGSVSESVHDQWSGFTVEPGDAEDIADKMIHLLHNPQTADMMGRNGREHVQTNGSLDTMVELYEQLIHRIHDQKCSRLNRDASDAL
jgi:glycosyltransferase involved in cell wall biosynthesis